MTDAIVAACLIIAVVIGRPLLRVRFSQSPQLSKARVSSVFDLPDVIKEHRRLMAPLGVLLILAGFVWLFLGIYVATSNGFGANVVIIPFLALVVIGSLLVALRFLAVWFKFMQGGSGD